jgi:hypothetical protein
MAAPVPEIMDTSSIIRTESTLNFSEIEKNVTFTKWCSKFMETL